MLFARVLLPNRDSLLVDNSRVRHRPALESRLRKVMDLRKIARIEEYLKIHDLQLDFDFRYRYMFM